MPPREEEELDPVTLHNQALMNMEDEAETGFLKLQFLLQHNPCPPGTRSGHCAPMSQPWCHDAGVKLLTAAVWLFARRGLWQFAAALLQV